MRHRGLSGAFAGQIRHAVKPVDDRAAPTVHDELASFVCGELAIVGVIVGRLLDAAWRKLFASSFFQIAFL